MRHSVYANELGQHPPKASGALTDSLDHFNTYLVAEIAGTIAGFISITPPDRGTYSIDKYFPREALGFPVDDGLFEVRLLTVEHSNRRQRLAALLMYAAFRWVEAHGGTRIVAIGRREILSLYLKAGLQAVGRSTQSGAVAYELLQGPVPDLRAGLNAVGKLVSRLIVGVDWQLPMPFWKPAGCFHGGAFFDAIGDDFKHLERRSTIVNADVLDAWFPPSPAVLTALAVDPGWWLRTSPPTDCGGLTRAIAAARGVRAANVLVGAGSSDLIFRAFREWLQPSSKAVIVDPTYGEYAHVLEAVAGCDVRRVPLTRERGFQLDLDRLAEVVAEGCDLLVLVNPNSPTGHHTPRADLESFLRHIPARTRVWIDETYVDYVGAGASLEQVAAWSENVVVCKSMSKVYALSGARVAYLCAGPHQLESLRAVTPPWAVSLPAQMAAVFALGDPDYYRARYAETENLKRPLASALAQLGLEVLPGCANFLLCLLPVTGPTAAEVVAGCRPHGVFLRDAGATSQILGSHALRVAVKSGPENQRIIACLRQVLAG